MAKEYSEVNTKIILIKTNRGSNKTRTTTAKDRPSLSILTEPSSDNGALVIFLPRNSSIEPKLMLGLCSLHTICGEYLISLKEKG